MTYQQETNKKQINKKVAKGTKTALDFLFFLGIIITVTIPLSLKWLGTYLDEVEQHYISFILLYGILGIISVLILWELRKIFQTVLNENCFIMQNVASLRKMSIFSFLIVIASIIRSVIFPTMAAIIIIIVFLIAGLFSQVLAAVFEEAIYYKEENDLTI